MKRIKYFILLTALTILLVCVLEYLKSNEPITGVYKGSYDNGIETITVNTDGTYTQEFIRNSRQIYKSSGRWRFDSYTKIERVDFYNFLYLFDYKNNHFSDPKKLDVVVAVVLSGNTVIAFNEDIDYIVTKQ